ncbi:D-Ala-D-Ala carboxypeptidase family metallohydrolase [Pseudomonas sp. UM16]|uniref:D-Ala-D-Ala carboxypeptidase family metallohydrolase n=1 Tax=Pseudomonas sp. UM16 TaxID=3158962 RepID=UPI00398F9D8C
MYLSEHFTLAEMTVSESAVRLGIDNTPDAETLGNLRRLCVLLEQVRRLIDQPIVVSSGYRCPALNRAIGGSSRSAHMQGLAADVNVPGLTPKAFARRVADSPLMFDQLILEYDQWVHLGLSSLPERRQLLTIRKGTGYLPGLV